MTRMGFVSFPRSIIMNRCGAEAKVFLTRQAGLALHYHIDSSTVLSRVRLIRSRSGVIVLRKNHKTC